MKKLAFAAFLVLVSSASYAITRSLGAEASGSAPGLAAVATSSPPVQTGARDRAPGGARRELRGERVVPGPLPSEIRLPENLTALDHLVLEKGAGAALLRSAFMREFKRLTQSAKEACVHDVALEPSQVQVVFKIWAAGETLRIDDLDAVTAYNGAPVPPGVLSCFDGHLRGLIRQDLKVAGARFPDFAESVAFKFRLGDNRLCASDAPAGP